MLLRVAQSEGVARTDVLVDALSQFERENPPLVALGGASALLDKVDLAQGKASEPRPIIDLLTRPETREKALAFLQQSRRPGVQQILKNRALTNTVLFPSAMSASGQALEAAIVTAGLLFQGDSFAPTFRDAFEGLTMLANRGENPGSLELVYLDLLSLGRRLDWVSLTELVKGIEDIGTLRDVAEAMRAHDESAANVFSAVVLSGNAKGVAKYLARFPETGMNDLNFALRSGRGAVEVLLRQQQRVYYAGQVRNKIVTYDPFGAFFYAMAPTAAVSRAGGLALKYLFLILASLCVARGVGMITVPLEHRFGMRFAADSVMALAIAFVIAVAAEPFISLPTQENFPVRFQLPTLVSAATSAKLQNITRPMKNQLSLASLAIFFVIQAVIYIWCLTKLAEIRRQPLAARMKLKLLENEDNLFDTGLYVGFVGSVISLIVMSIGLQHLSMMAYSSTAFGIIFVSVLKIFHVRPLRRKLILESEAQS
jgi:hypothetical protein